MRLNVLLLMVVAAFLPFPTGLLAEASTSRETPRAAVVAYGATAVLIEALLGIMRRYASAHAEIMDREAPAEPAGVQRVIAHPTLYGTAIIAGVLVLPRVAAVAYLLIAARAVLLPGGEGRLTLLGSPRPGEPQSPGGTRESK